MTTKEVPFYFENRYLGEINVICNPDVNHVEITREHIEKFVTALWDGKI
jgi:hypothetical protein